MNDNTICRRCGNKLSFITNYIKGITLCKKCEIKQKEYEKEERKRLFGTKWYPS